MNEWTFQCDFYDVPLPTYCPNALPKKHFEIDDPDVKRYKGTLNVNLSTEVMHKGSFKMAHPREILFQGGENPFTDRRVCVKQVYEPKEGGTAILRLRV